MIREGHPGFDALAAPTDGWKQQQQHDDSYYRTAIEKMP